MFSELRDPGTLNLSNPSLGLGKMPSSLDKLEEDELKVSLKLDPGDYTLEDLSTQRYPHDDSADVKLQDQPIFQYNGEKLQVHSPKLYHGTECQEEQLNYFQTSQDFQTSQPHSSLGPESKLNLLV